VSPSGLASRRSKTHVNLSKNPWLGAGIVLYVLVFAASIFYQVPTEKTILAALGSGRAPSDPQVRKLANGQRAVGMAMGLSIVVIAVLMVWKPGAGVWAPRWPRSFSCSASRSAGRGRRPIKPDLDSLQELALG
jgi:hypothetical protein